MRERSFRNQLFYLRVSKQVIVVKFWMFLLSIKFRRLIEGVEGWQSTCKEKHVFFCDLDDVNPDWLVNRIKLMIKKFRMSDVHIFVTKENSFHLICFDKFTFGEVMDILKWFDNELTYKYQIFGAVRGYWVLRYSIKRNRGFPQYWMTIKGNSFRKQSSAHCTAFNKFYGTDFKLRNPDRSSNVKMDVYPTVIKEEELNGR